MRPLMTRPTSSLARIFALLLAAPLAVGCGSGGNGGGAGGGGAATTSTARGTSAQAPRVEGEAAPHGRETETETETETEQAAAVEAPPASPVDRALRAWAGLLTAYVTDDGGFRYAALVASPADRAALGVAVQAVADARLTDLLDRDAQLAFYLNAYNILTVNAVVTRFPIDSVMSVPGFFDVLEHNVLGTSMTLNALENDIIRAQFHEPRIHFAVNCASAGCPWLDSAPFTASNLEPALDRLTRGFVRRTTSVDSRRRRVVVSQLFEWFAGDFEPAGGVRGFLVAHIDNEATRAQVADERNRVAYFEYDWALNARP